VAGKVTTGLAESNDRLNVYTPGSAPHPMNDNEYGKPIPFKPPTTFLQGVVLTERNTTGPPCSVGRPTDRAPGPPAGSVTDDRL